MAVLADGRGAEFAKMGVVFSRTGVAGDSAEFAKMEGMSALLDQSRRTIL